MVVHPTTVKLGSEPEDVACEAGCGILLIVSSTLLTLNECTTDPLAFPIIQQEFLTCLGLPKSAGGLSGLSHRVHQGLQHLRLLLLPLRQVADLQGTEDRI